MRSFTTYFAIATAVMAAVIVLFPGSSVQAAAGQVLVTVRDELRLPIAGATVEVSCNAVAYATLGTTSATGTVVGDPTIGTTCVNGSAPLFRVSSSTFPTQYHPIIYYSLLPYYTSVDPNTTSTSISGSTNRFIFGVETTGTYAISAWNAVEDPTSLPFPTGPAEYTTTTSLIAFNWGTDTSPYPGINATDWQVRATKTVTLGAGWYQFDIASDDGSRVILDGTTILDKYFLQALPGRPYTKRLYVSAGSHTIQIQYYEHTGLTGLYFRFYPIDTPGAPVIDIGAPVSSPVNNRIAPSLGLHTDTAGNVTFGGGCTSTDPIQISVGTSTISMNILPNGTYGSCTMTVTDPDTELSTTVSIPSFAVDEPPLISISTCDELFGLDQVSTNYAVDIELANDIDCGEIPRDSIEWSGHPFIGIFDGNGNTIENIALFDFAPNIGIFAEVNGATFKNLRLDATNIEGYQNIGLIAGSATNPTLTNVHLTNGVITFIFPFSLSEMGGIFGEVYLTNGTTTHWSNVSVDTTINASRGKVGGLAGIISMYNTSTLLLDNTQASGDSTYFGSNSSNKMGGFFGSLSMTASTTATIINSSVNTNLDANSSSGNGGFIGTLTLDTSGETRLSISYSSSSATISGANSLGGLIGETAISDLGGNLTVRLDHNQLSASISGTGNNVGGVIGYLQNIVSTSLQSNIYIDSNAISGTISGVENVGGILGGSGSNGNGFHIDHTNGIGELLISNNSSTASINGNSAGGIVGFLSCESENLSQDTACSIRQNTVSGNVVGTSKVGGIAGSLDGDINVEDIYATGDVTGATDVGGLIGALTSNRSSTNIQNGYYAGTIHTAGGSPLRIGGIIGNASSVSSYPTIRHLFTDVALDDVSGVGQIGGAFGALTDITPEDISYRLASGTAPSCVYGITSSAFCSRKLDTSYFYLTDNDPLNSWNFTTVWLAHTNTLPTLRMAAVGSDNNGPRLTELFVRPASTDAQVYWTTNEPASSNVVYGLGSSFDQTVGVRDLSPRVQRHQVALSSLLPCRTYQFKAISADRYGNNSTSTGTAFTTTGCESGKGSFGGTPSPILLVPVSNVSLPQATSAQAFPPSTTQSAPIDAQGQPLLVAGSSASPSPRCYQITFTRDLRVGMNAPDVKELQRFLNTHDAPIFNGTSSLVGSETTYFGQGTKRALMNFQRARQLPTDGLFASTTRQLIQSLVSQATCPTNLVFGRALKLGMNGTDVRQLQGFLGVSETGFFGPLTQKALQLFQKTRRLTISGTTDEATRTLLNTLVK